MCRETNTLLHCEIATCVGLGVEQMIYCIMKKSCFELPELVLIIFE